MSQRVHLLLKRTEGALVRLLGTVQRRGFEVAAIHTYPHAEPELWRVELELSEGDRDVSLLERQLEKLYDVVALGDQLPRAEQA